jgi:hypothetical protein
LLEIEPDCTPFHTTGLAIECLLSLQSAPKWFAVYKFRRHEKREQQYLNQRDIEPYLPLLLSQRKWRDGSRVTLVFPLFPAT